MAKRKQYYLRVYAFEIHKFPFYTRLVTFFFSQSNVAKKKNTRVYADLSRTRSVIGFRVKTLIVQIKIEPYAPRRSVSFKQLII